MSSPQDQVAVAPLRVVVVDDRAERRSLMVDVVKGDNGAADVVAEADTPENALLLVSQHDTDAVLIDIRMPIAEGLRTIRKLHQTFPRLGIVACSFDMDRPTVDRALARGAHAYLAKPTYHGEVLAALDAARRSAQAAPAPALEAIAS